MIFAEIIDNYLYVYKDEKHFLDALVMNAYNYIKNNVIRKFEDYLKNILDELSRNDNNNNDIVEQRIEFSDNDTMTYRSIDVDYDIYITANVKFDLVDNTFKYEIVDKKQHIVFYDKNVFIDYTYGCVLDLISYDDDECDTSVAIIVYKTNYEDYNSFAYKINIDYIYHLDNLKKRIISYAENARSDLYKEIDKYVSSYTFSEEDCYYINDEDSSDESDYYCYDRFEVNYSDLYIDYSEFHYRRFKTRVKVYATADVEITEYDHDIVYEKTKIIACVYDPYDNVFNTY